MECLPPCLAHSRWAQEVLAIIIIHLFLLFQILCVCVCMCFVRNDWKFFCFLNYMLLITFLQLSWFLSLCPSSTQHPLLPQAIPQPLFMSLGHAQVLWLLHFLYCTVHSHGYSVTVYLYFLLPSPLLATFFCVCNSNFLYVLKLNVIFIFLFF